MSDFVSLSRAARDLPGPDTHDRLWSAWFALPVWHFIKARSPSGWLPYSGFVNGARCILGFTDASRALAHIHAVGIGLDPRVASPLLPLSADDTIHLVPQLRGWGVAVLAVDLGPDAFYAPLDGLFGMLQRYRNAPVSPPPLVAPPAPFAPHMLSVDALLALPAWHVVTTRQDASFPDLAARGPDLVAQIYSSSHAVSRFAGTPPPPTTVMPPRAALTMLADIELVRFVRFDGQLEVELVDLGLQSHAPRS